MTDHSDQTDQTPTDGPARTTHPRRRQTQLAAAVAGAAALVGTAVLTTSPTASATAYSQDLKAVRVATARFHSPEQALRAGYLASPECVAAPFGGMGFHYENPALMADPAVDAAQPGDPALRAGRGRGARARRRRVLPQRERRRDGADALRPHLRGSDARTPPRHGRRTTTCTCGSGRTTRPGPSRSSTPTSAAEEERCTAHSSRRPRCSPRPSPRSSPPWVSRPPATPSSAGSRTRRTSNVGVLLPSAAMPVRALVRRDPGGADGRRPRRSLRRPPPGQLRRDRGRHHLRPALPRLARRQGRAGGRTPAATRPTTAPSPHTRCTTRTAPATTSPSWCWTSRSPGSTSRRCLRPGCSTTSRRPGLSGSSR